MLVKNIFIGNIQKYDNICDKYSFCEFIILLPTEGLLWQGPGCLVEKHTIAYLIQGT